MPNTPSGLRYPSSDGHTNTWLYWQQLAEDVDRIVKVAVANQAARLALVSPAQGLLVVEKDTRRIYARTATGWDLIWAPKITYADRPLIILQRVGISVAPATSDDWTRVTGWTTESSSGGGLSIDTASGLITCNRDGWLSIAGYAYSDDTVAGRSGVRFRVPGAGSSFPTEHLYDNRGRPSNTAYSNAGMLRQPINWSGRVQGGETTYVDLQQDSADNGAVSYNVYLALEYLDAA